MEDAYLMPLKGIVEFDETLYRRQGQGQGARLQGEQGRRGRGRPARRKDRPQGHRGPRPPDAPSLHTGGHCRRDGRLLHRRVGPVRGHRGRRHHPRDGQSRRRRVGTGRRSHQHGRERLESAQALHHRGLPQGQRQAPGRLPRRTRVALQQPRQPVPLQGHAAAAAQRRTRRVQRTGGLASYSSPPVSLMPRASLMAFGT